MRPSNYQKLTWIPIALLAVAGCRTQEGARQYYEGNNPCWTGDAVQANYSIGYYDEEPSQVLSVTNPFPVYEGFLWRGNVVIGALFTLRFSVSQTPTDRLYLENAQEADEGSWNRTTTRLPLKRHDVYIEALGHGFYDYRLQTGISIQTIHSVCVEKSDEGIISSVWLRK